MLPDTGAASFLRVFQQCIFGREGDQSRCRLRYLWLIRSQRKASCEPGIKVNMSQVTIKLFFFFLFIDRTLIRIRVHKDNLHSASDSILPS